MITVESKVNPSQHNNKRSKKSIIFCVLLIIIVGGVAAICLLGSPKVYVQNKHVLYSYFEDSSAHKNLINSLDRAKLSIVVGKESDGLLNFIQHYANKLIKSGRKVYFEEVGSNKSALITYARDINEKAQSLIGLSSNDCDWILTS